MALTPGSPPEIVAAYDAFVAVFDREPIQADVEL